MAPLTTEQSPTTSTCRQVRARSIQDVVRTTGPPTTPACAAARTPDRRRPGGGRRRDRGGRRQAVKSPDDVAAAIAGKKPGDEVEVEYYRGRRRKTRPGQARASARRRPRAGRQLPSRRTTAAGCSRTCRSACCDPMAVVTKVKICGITELEDARRAASARRVGAGADLLAGQPARCAAGRRRGDRRRAQAQRRADRRVRERHARRGGRGRGPLRADPAPAARRRGPGLLPRGRPAHGRAGDQGGAGARRRLGPRPRAPSTPTSTCSTPHVPGSPGGTGRDVRAGSWRGPTAARPAGALRRSHPGERGARRSRRVQPVRGRRGQRHRGRAGRKDPAQAERLLPRGGAAEPERAPA